MSSKPLAFLRTHIWGTDNPQSPWPLDAKTATGLLLCILLFSLVGWLYLTQASQMAATGHHMRQTVQEIERIERENALLGYKVAELETLPRIEARARQIGLGPMTRMTYLVIPEMMPPLQSASVEVMAAADPGDSPAALPEDAGPLAELLKFWDDVRAEFEVWIGQS
jgi:hypothetical protein